MEPNHHGTLQAKNHGDAQSLKEGHIGLLSSMISVVPHGPTNAASLAGGAETVSNRNVDRAPGAATKGLAQSNQSNHRSHDPSATQSGLSKPLLQAQAQAQAQQHSGYVPDEHQMAQPEQQFIASQSSPISPIRQAIGKSEKDYDAKYRSGEIRELGGVKSGTAQPESMAPGQGGAVKSHGHPHTSLDNIQILSHLDRSLGVAEINPPLPLKRARGPNWTTDQVFDLAVLSCVYRKHAFRPLSLTRCIYGHLTHLGCQHEFHQVYRKIKNIVTCMSSPEDAEKFAMHNPDAYLLFRVTFGYIPLQSLPERLLNYMSSVMEQHQFEDIIPESHESMSAEDEHEGLEESISDCMVNQFPSEPKRTRHSNGSEGEASSLRSVHLIYGPGVSSDGSMGVIPGMEGLNEPICNQAGENPSESDGGQNSERRGGDKCDGEAALEGSNLRAIKTGRAVSSHSPPPLNQGKNKPLQKPLGKPEAGDDNADHLAAIQAGSASHLLQQRGKHFNFYQYQNPGQGFHGQLQAANRYSPQQGVSFENPGPVAVRQQTLTHPIADNTRSTGRLNTRGRALTTDELASVMELCTQRILAGILKLQETLSTVQGSIEAMQGIAHTEKGSVQTRQSIRQPPTNTREALTQGAQQVIDRLAESAHHHAHHHDLQGHQHPPS